MNWANVRLLVTDFDGVWTDDAVYTDQHGNESVRCLRADGYGITRLQAAGVPVIVLSAEVNPVVAARCRKLNVMAFQGLDGSIESKLDVLEKLTAARTVQLSEVAYMGNDVNDIECLQAVGFPIVVQNAWRAVFDVWWPSSSHPIGSGRRPSDAGTPYVTSRAGGYGAVREVCDLILEARNG